MHFLHFVSGIRRHSGLPLGIHFDENPGENPPANPAAPPAGDEAPPPANKDLIQLTPAQLKERLTRAENDAKAKTLKDLGYESPEKIKERLAKADELEKAQMTETERLQREITENKAKLDDTTATLARTLADRETEKRQNAIEKVLIAQGITDPDDLEIAMARANKFAATTLGDTLPTADNLKPFVDELREKRPVLFNGGEVPLNAGPQQTPKINPPQDKGPKPKTEAEIKAMSPEEFAAHTMQTISQNR